jgi:RNA polymerase sigma factor (sigma-70 family)
VTGVVGLAGGVEKKTRVRRDYRPTVEGLEALRLLSSAAQAHPLPGMIAERDLLTDPLQEPLAVGEEGSSAAVSSATWDAALGHARLADLLSHPEAGASAAVPAIAATTAPATVPDSRAITSGLTQLNKYLSRTWYRAGIPAQLHEDSSQAVYATLLQVMGRAQFDSLVGEVGNWGIRDVFSRETSEGVTFFRAVDMVKKRMQREKVHQSLDSIDVPSQGGDQGRAAALRAALQDAIDHNLSPREAALIKDTLMGMSPAEIALRWGVAPKTVSNEKSRVLQKLREALVDHEMN